MGRGRSDRVGQWRTGPDRDGQGRVEQYRTGLGRAASGKVGQGQAGPNRAEQGQTGQARPERTGQGLTGPDRARNGQLVPGRARQDRAFCIYAYQQHSCPEHCAVPALSLSFSQTIAYVAEPWPYLPGHTSARPCPAWHPRSCPVVSSPVLSDLHRPCSAMSGAALFHPALYCLVRPIQPCLTLFCSTLPDAARPGPIRPRATPSGSALLYPVWRCPVRPHPAWRCPSLLWLALPDLALSGTVLPISIQSCPCRTLSGPSGPSWDCSALSGLAQSCLTLSGPVWPCLALLGPALSGVALFHPVRPCAALSCVALIYPVRPRLFDTVRPCLVCMKDVIGYLIVDNALSEFKLYSSGQQSENKEQWC